MQFWYILKVANTSVKALGQERFVRTKTLGEEYTEDSLNTRILYREMGAGTAPSLDNTSQLRAAYVAITVTDSK